MQHLSTWFNFDWEKVKKKLLQSLIDPIPSFPPPPLIEFDLIYILCFTWVVMMEAGSLKTWPVRMVKVVSSSLQPITKLVLVITTTENSVTILVSILCRCQWGMRMESSFLLVPVEITNSGVTILASIIFWWHPHWPTPLAWCDRYISAPITYLVLILRQ